MSAAFILIIALLKLLSPRRLFNRRGGICKRDMRVFACLGRGDVFVCVCVFLSGH